MNPAPALGLFALVIVLVLDRCDYEHDYEQECDGLFGFGHVPRCGIVTAQAGASSAWKNWP